MPLIRREVASLAGLVESAMCRCACRHDTRGLHGSVVACRMTTHCVWPA